jgi:hypothetical protein
VFVSFVSKTIYGPKCVNQQEENGSFKVMLIACLHSTA